MPCHGHSEPSDANFSLIITSFIHSDNAIAPAAVITDFTKHINYAYIKKNADESQIEHLLWSAWAAVTTAAGNTYSPIVHQKLSSLLAKLKDQGPLTRNFDAETCHVWDKVVYSDLPVFGAQMRELWDTARPSASDGSVDEWRNVNAFAARLTQDGVEDFSLYAIWTLREALEDPDANFTQLLPAVAPWFAVCGARLRELVKEGKSFAVDGQPDPAKLGGLCERAGVKSSGFSSERWGFWESRLEEIEKEGKELVSEEAAEALQKLRGFESNGSVS